jgi:hypothetical protein
LKQKGRSPTNRIEGSAPSFSPTSLG